jgi:ABC-type molybdate transport system substrate-binding protein
MPGLLRTFVTAVSGGTTGKDRQMGTVLEWHCLMLCSVLSSGATGEELVLFGPGSLREAMPQVGVDYQTAYSVTVRTAFGPSGRHGQLVDHPA